MHFNAGILPSSCSSVPGPRTVRVRPCPCVAGPCTSECSDSKHFFDCHGNPSNYLTLLRELHPGETLFLVPGDYKETEHGSGLPIFHLKGSVEKVIVITGPNTGPRPIFFAPNIDILLQTNGILFDLKHWEEIANVHNCKRIATS